MKSDASILADGIRATKLFGDNGSASVAYLALEVAPQTSTSVETQTSYTSVALVGFCEDGLATLVIDGERLELHSGDHLSIPTGSKFQYVNSSLTTPLKLRIIQKVNPIAPARNTRKSS